MLIFVSARFAPDKNGMCLTIPKKVISIDGDSVTVELFDGSRQTVKSIVKLKSGDFCVTQQNIVVDKISKKEANELFDEWKT